MERGQEEHPCSPGPHLVAEFYVKATKSWFARLPTGLQTPKVTAAACVLQEGAPFLHRLQPQDQRERKFLPHPSLAHCWPPTHPSKLVPGLGLNRDSHQYGDSFPINVADTCQAGGREIHKGHGHSSYIQGQVLPVMLATEPIQ